MTAGLSLSQSTPWLFIGLGWKWDADGVWTVKTHAKKNADFMAGRRGDVRRHQPEPICAEDGAFGHQPHDLPIVAVCPWCGTPQLLDPTTLAVGKSEHEHTKTLRHRHDGSLEQILCCDDGQSPAHAHPAVTRWRIDD